MSAGGTVEVRSPVMGTVVAVVVGPGTVVGPGSEVVLVESMKVHHGVTANVSGAVATVHCAVGEVVDAGALLATVASAALSDVPPAGTTKDGGGQGAAAGAEPDAGVAGPAGRADLAAVRDRHAQTLDLARPRAVERRRRSGQRTARENVAAVLDPASFVEYGPLAIAAQRHRESVEELIQTTPADGMVAGTGTIDGRPVAVAVYDYTVLAGTQGVQGHRKQDRIFALGERRRLPVVLYAEGGGGRPGDQDRLSPTGLDEPTFAAFARLPGLVPLVGVTSGFCFAGNAALLACCDVIIATAGSNIGMGGPAMVEGGGLGRFEPTAIGPVDVQVANGVADRCARRLPVRHPGVMVGPSAEERALVRHAGRLFVAGANLSVPHGTVVLRKGYGLGAMAMGAGGFKSGLFAVSWPTGEFGGMNLEGAVRLGYRREMEAIDDAEEREAFFAAKLAGMIERGRALNAATYFEFDDVIDPAESRRWIAAAFAGAPHPGPRRIKKRPYADTW